MIHSIGEALYRGFHLPKLSSSFPDSFQPGFSSEILSLGEILASYLGLTSLFHSSIFVLLKYSHVVFEFFENTILGILCLKVFQVYSR